ncbi:MAG: hypothetical protein UR27_C0029G0006 [Candidatus Peregrinibacteria bacterium GW2011_GWA2_33_10]|nr:MAG: hypothetical protein UR27_C0029G0006 [Candidatus Peregrinibacteria bacterium GW2011_GWA2_33_10]KKP38172.1 MAG: hypothetical protein UR30_C0024G0006 [Candidatus Peregrinibacteria bacterium GW2011_GWC2_33_13]OGJ48987.1 MAG: hypothetical protein A2229_00150 [Candidatus Peregrinibacteria bacterium RIFOXYA2_FULL_33_7]
MVNDNLKNNKEKCFNLMTSTILHANVHNQENLDNELAQIQKKFDQDKEAAIALDNSKEEIKKVLINLSKAENDFKRFYALYLLQKYYGENLSRENNL